MTAEELRARFPNAGESFVKLNADNNFSRLKEIEEKQSRSDDRSTAEKDLHHLIINMLISRGIKWFGHGSMAHKSKYTRGWPDFVIPLPNGKILFWEIKTTSGPVTKDQDECLKWLVLHGHAAYVIRSYQQGLNIMNEQFPNK